MSTAELLAELDSFTACDVADALQKLSVLGFIPDISMYSPQWLDPTVKIIGPAFTVKMVKVDSENPPPTPKSSVHFVDQVPSGSVLFITAPSDCTNAVVGGLLATRAQVLGASGIVVNGRIRDLDELQEMGFPVFAKGQSCVGTGGRVVSAFNPAISSPRILVQGDMGIPMWVTNGDILVADLNGVVRIPQDQLEAVVDLCKRCQPIEAQCQRDIQNGHGFRETLAKYRP
ncbi:hypothetical protein H4R33_006491 [Dimargaris cristalligena]|uniref:RraA-like protein n=1 Tax=Dimargaris cristalligena TaxID=215637 RepID=A0A4P9ZYU1_9FUNG|nr:hypothetical protein H4R33_006491 [Dimargaris cristalligena]RKP38925.1 RraA-like protein [Dimargaris cristalligena]|eukprot:RKP38925.1 RraA-like protein [Dimargaris cristalligena]